MKNFGILNGPNLNRLGVREPQIYGSKTLSDLELQVQAEAKSLGVAISFFQSNHEGHLIDKIHYWADNKWNGFIFNPGAFTHTSIALYDAILASNLPCIEVHISNIYKRESSRHKSFTAPACIGVISGLGFSGYSLALQYLAQLKIFD